MRYNQQDEFLVGAITDPSLAVRSPKREKLDVNVVFRWRRYAEVFFAIDNLTNQPFYRLHGVGDHQYAGPTWAGSRRFNFGVQGKF